MTIESTDEAAAAVATAPRVSLADIESQIVFRLDTTGTRMVGMVPDDDLNQLESLVCNSLDVLSVCLLVMKNGFTVIGKSAPASPENYSADLGKKFAYEDAIRQLWPLMGFALRTKLYEETDGS